METKTRRFSAFQITPSGRLYEEEFLMVLHSIEALSSHPLAESVVGVALKNRVPIKPVLGFQEFPGLGLGGAVELGPNLFRAAVIGSRDFMAQCGMSVPQTLEVPIKRWGEEKALVVYCGWDGWVRGVLKFLPPD